MEARLETKTKMALILSEKEATWLQGYLQNAIGYLHEEDEEDTIMRREIFTGLVEAWDN